MIVRFWGVTLAPPAISSALYFIVFGEIIGKRIGSIDGFDYIEFMAPGVIVLWVIPYSFGHTAGGFLGAKFFKYVEELLVALAAVVAALAGFITALFAKSFDQLFMFQGLILTPLMYLGGVFNSLSTLPPWAQILSRANPMFYMVNAFRYGLLGESDVPIGLSMALMSAAGVMLLLAAWALLVRGVGIRE